MAIGDSYLFGHQLAYIAKGSVHVEWLKNVPSLDLTNKAFRFYYDAYNRVSRAGGKLSTPILTDLSSAAHEGCSPIYSADLAGVFQTLWKTTGRWYEDYSKNYCGPQVNGAVQVPVGVCNFLNAVDYRAETLQNSYSSLTRYLADVKNSKSNHRWEEIGAQTEGIKNSLENAQPLLWLAPKAAGGHELISSWVSRMGTVYSFLDNYNKFRNELAMGKVNAVLVSGLTHIVSNAVPIFGDIYAQAIGMIPSLVNWAKSKRDERDRLIREIVGN